MVRRMHLLLYCIFSLCIVDAIIYIYHSSFLLGLDFLTRLIIISGVGKGLDPDFDFLSAAAPYMVEIKGTGRYLVDEMKKRLLWK